MTRSTKLLIPVLAAVAAVAAFWFLVLSPKQDEMAKLDAGIATQRAMAAQAQQQVATYESAKGNYRKNYTMVARLGKAVPGDDDVRSLLVQLDATAKRAKVDFNSLSVTAATAAPGSGTTIKAGALAPPPGTVTVGSSGFSAMPFSFAFSGSFFRLSDFLSRLERFVTVQNQKIDVTGRLLLLGSIAVTPETAGTTTSGKLQVQIGAAAYLLPKTDPVPGTTAPATGGATPATPAAASGGTTPTTTATITGAQ